VRARGVHRFWRGPGQTRPFAVDAQTQDAPPIRMPGTLLQEAAVPGWLPKAALAVVAACVTLALLWFGLFRPVVKDTARDAAKAAVKSALSSAATTPAGGSGGGSGGGGGGGGSSPTPTPTPTPSTSKPTTPPKTTPPKPALPVPSPYALQLDQASPNLTADAKKQITVTDLVLQNPGADKGLLVLSRNGQALITMRLEDFRDYDLHYVTPIVVPSGQSFSLQVTCQNAAAKPCSPAVLVSGMVDTVAL